MLPSRNSPARRSSRTAARRRRDLPRRTRPPVLRRLHAARRGGRARSAPDVLRGVRAVELVSEVLDAAGAGEPVLVSGCVGPRGDGYQATELMSAAEAEEYHARQVGVFTAAGGDLVSALNVTYAEEATGITRAAVAAGIPVAVSFTVETDGRLPSGQPLGQAIEQVDGETDSAAAYFMGNCAHPTHFAHVLENGGWVARVRGLRANASTKSHEERDEAEELDEGDPVALAADYRGLRRLLPNLTVVGGCCGTDHRHVEEICKVWTAQS